MSAAGHEVRATSSAAAAGRPSTNAAASGPSRALRRLVLVRPSPEEDRHPDGEDQGQHPAGPTQQGHPAECRQDDGPRGRTHRCVDAGIRWVEDGAAAGPHAPAHQA